MVIIGGSLAGGNHLGKGVIIGGRGLWQGVIIGGRGGNNWGSLAGDNH